MKKNLFLWQLTGLTFTAIFGTLLHFLYPWTNAVALAPFCAVNESTWEHMKILFFPLLLFALLQCCFFYKEYQNFWCVKCIGTLLGTLCIPILFYTYNGSFGQSPAWLNILFFFLAAALAFLMEFWLFKKKIPLCKYSAITIIALYITALLFVFFTFLPPKLPLFQDPITGFYGII